MGGFKDLLREVGCTRVKVRVELGCQGSRFRFRVGYCQPLSNTWIISRIWLYVALNRTPNMDCYWGGQYPSSRPLGLGLSRAAFKGF